MSRNALIGTVLLLAVLPTASATTNLGPVEVRGKRYLDAPGGTAALSSGGGGPGIQGIKTLDRVLARADRPKKGESKQDDTTMGTPSVLINDVDADTSKDCGRGNPILISTGNKVEQETDFITSGEMPLHLIRTYNHYWKGAGLFGKNWVSNFDYKLTFGSTDLNACYPRPGGGACGIGAHTTIYAWRPDGRTIRYDRAGDGVFYEDKPGPISRIVPQADGSFILYGEDNLSEVYSSTGYVSAVQNEPACAGPTRTTAPIRFALPIPPAAMSNSCGHRAS